MGSLSQVMHKPGKFGVGGRQMDPLVFRADRGTCTDMGKGYN